MYVGGDSRSRPSCFSFLAIDGNSILFRLVLISAYSSASSSTTSAAFLASFAAAASSFSLIFSFSFIRSYFSISVFVYADTLPRRMETRASTTIVITPKLFLVFLRDLLRYCTVSLCSNSNIMIMKDQLFKC